MTGTTPKARARTLHKELKRLYDEAGPPENVTDMLVDLRHLCDVRGWDFADLDRQAYQHYLVEHAAGTVGKGEQ